MKAVLVKQFGPFDQVQIGEAADPQPGVGEVVVDLEASDVNFPDILYCEGKYQVKPPLPFSPGLAGAGRVALLGESGSGLSPGQRVMVLPAYGTYAEKVRVRADLCFPMPERMPFEVGAAFGLVYQTAYLALVERAACKAGDTVLVLGATGGVGMATIQLAKALGAGRVIAATRGDEGVRFARRVGADVAIDVAGHNLREHLRDEVRNATGGHGADIVIDPIGGEISAAALRAVAWCGRLIVVGFASGEIPQVPANYLLVKNITISGLQSTDYRVRQIDKVQAAQAHIFTLWEQGLVEPVISRTLPLERFADALRDLRDGIARGKIVLTIGSGNWERHYNGGQG